jgi:hypothetical protein
MLARRAEADVDGRRVFSSDADVEDVEVEAVDGA